MQEDEIKREIKDYIVKCGGIFSSWYVGISSDPRTRLFSEHAVDKEQDLWIYRTAVSSEIARSAEKHFIYEVGCDGGTGGGDADAKTVYAYRKKPYTRQ